jgi:WD40 repeat protein
MALEGGDVALWDVADQSFRNVALHHEADVTSLAFSADGLTLAAGSLDDTEVTLWHLDASNPWLGKIEESARVADLDLSSDGQLLAVAGLLEPTVRLWRVGSQPESIGELSDLPSVTSVSFSGDGRTVATGGGVQVLLWDVIALKRLGTPISRPTSIVTGVELAPDGHTVAVAGYRDLTVHEADSGRPLGESLRFADAVDATAMSGDGVLVAAGTDNGVIQLWSLSPESQKIRACEVANRELTDDEWLSLVPGRAPITLCGH